jgi:hypothetical protein
VNCACLSLYALEGVEALAYADEHLEEVSTDPVAWTVIYRCPVTGRVWLLDYPDSQLQGGGPPRLRQLDVHGEPISGQVGGD